MFVGAVCHACLLLALSELSASGRWLRWLRSPLEAVSGTAVVTWRGMCHPPFPLEFLSPLPSQSLLFLLLSVIVILENSCFKILIIKKKIAFIIYADYLAVKKNVLPQKFSEISHAFSAIWRWMCKHIVPWALTYTFLNILGSMFSFSFINVKLTSRYKTNV